MDGSSPEDRSPGEAGTADEQLVGRQERFSLLYENSPVPSQSLDAEGCLIEVNQAWLDALGYARDEVLGRWFGDFLAPGQADLFRERFPRFKAAGRTRGVEFELLRKDGTRAQVVFDGNVVRDRQGDFLQTYCVFRDVSAMRAAAQEYRAILHTALDGFWLVDSQGRFLDVNDAYCELTGYSREELLRMGVRDVEALESAAEIARHMSRVLETGSDRFETRHRRKDGRLIDLDVSVRFLPEAGKFFVFLRDITGRKQAEAADRLYRQIIETAQEGIWTIDPEGRVGLVNQTLAAMFGYSPAEMVARPVTDFIDPAHHQRSAENRSRREQGIREQYEFSFRRRDGSALHTIVSTNPLYDEQGNYAGALGMLTDITRRRQDELALAARHRELVTLHRISSISLSAKPAQERYQEIVEEIRRATDFPIVAVTACDQARGVITFRAAIGQDFPPELPLGETFSGTVAATGRPIIETDAALVAGSQSGLARRLGIRTLLCFPLRAGQAVLGTLTLASPESIPVPGELAEWVESLANLAASIFQRDQAEEALRESRRRLEESEENYRNLFEKMLDGFALHEILCDGQGKPVDYRFLAVNPAFERLTGLEANRILGRTVREVLPGTEESWIETYGRVALTGEPVHFENHHQGLGRHYEVTAYRPAEGQFAVIFADVTARKRGEDALRDSEERFRSIVENSEAGYFFIDREGRFQRVNAAWLRLHGYASADEVVGRHFSLTQLPEHVEAAQAIVDELLRGVPLPRGEFTRRLKDGSAGYHSFSATPVRRGGVVVGLEGFVIDVTDRKRAEAAVLESERRYREILECARLIAVMLDLEGRLTFTNDFLLDLTGWRRDEVLGRNWFDTFLPADTGSEVKALYLAAIPAGGVPMYHEHDIVTRMGERRTIQWSNAILRDHEGSVTGATSIGEDITERKRLAEQLAQAQRLESVGRLAGGIAHDFNNLLTVINGHSDLVLKRLVDPDPLREHVAEVRKAGEKAAQLTRQLLAFSRRQVMQPRILDLNHAVAEMEKMLRRIIGEDIVLLTLPAENLGLVRADPGQVNQVLMNLAVNARDAMPSGGKLILETANMTLDHSYAEQHPGVDPGRFVVLAVSDTGVGMSDEVKSHMFEPFYTTKETGKGTGLGLATVYGIVKQSGGHIWVYSEPGKGTSFKIYLPRVEETESRIEPPAAGTPDLSGDETVLVVEDQQEVRRLASDTLRSFGYRVLEAANAGEALLVCERHATPIHLMLTDVIMPGMNGRDLARRVAPLRPEMKVLYMSGHTDNSVVHHGTLDSGLAYLQKPFSPESLALKVRQVLGPPSAKTCILVVDDEPAVRRLLGEILAGAGYEVLEAANGKQALAVVRARRVEVVITDLVMPEQEGIETIRQLHKECPELKLIAISGAYGSNILRTTTYLGANAALTKPVEADVLLETVRRVIGT